MVVFKRVAKAEELDQILRLQKDNLFDSVTPEDKVSEGFLTVKHDLDLLTRMNNVCPHIIAKSGESVVGYALCMHPDFSNEIEVLWPMFAEIDRHVSRSELSPFIIMGQICIDKAYRKQGIFRMLYETMQGAVQPNFKNIITEVDAKNIRSLQAHYAVGFEKLSSYQSGGQEWELIVLKTT